MTNTAEQIAITRTKVGSWVKNLRINALFLGTVEMAAPQLDELFDALSQEDTLAKLRAPETAAETMEQVRLPLVRKWLDIQPATDNDALEKSGFWVAFMLRQVMDEFVVDLGAQVNPIFRSEPRPVIDINFLYRDFADRAFSKFATTIGSAERTWLSTDLQRVDQQVFDRFLEDQTRVWAAAPAPTARKAPSP